MILHHERKFAGNPSPSLDSTTFYVQITDIPKTPKPYISIKFKLDYTRIKAIMALLPQSKVNSSSVYHNQTFQVHHTSDISCYFSWTLDSDATNHICPLYFFSFLKPNRLVKINYLIILSFPISKSLRLI